LTFSVGGCHFHLPRERPFRPLPSLKAEGSMAMPRVRTAGPLVSILVGLTEAAWAAPLTLPPGLDPGEQYRLVFVTSVGHDATSANIAVYNQFVSDVANSEPALAALGTTWTAIASTYHSDGGPGTGVDARDNTHTNRDRSSDPDLSIYNLAGDLIASTKQDLWDGSIGTAILYDEHGSVPSESYVWTGTQFQGLGVSGPVVGAMGYPTEVRLGHSNASDLDWIQGDSANWTSSFPLYAMSGVLIAIPEPDTAVLLAMGFAGLAWGARRHRRFPLKPPLVG
jgi:hypothetical protein